MTTAHETVVRSLRRRMWRAFQEEDVDMVMRAYTATRSDYEAWIAEEAAQRERQRQEETARLKEQQQKMRPDALKKFGNMVARSTQKLQSEALPKPKKERSEQAIVNVKPTPKVDRDVPCLQNSMNPSDVFCADDYKSPHDPYDDNMEVSSIRRRSKSNSKGPRLAGFWMRGSKEKVSEEDDEDVFMQMNVDFTTPLHEAARLGSAKLVRLFLAHGGLPNARNGQERTALHMAAGGLTAEEEGLLLAQAATRQQSEKPSLDLLDKDVGIRLPCMEKPQDSDEENEEHPAAAGAKKAALAVRSFFNIGSQPDKHDEPTEEAKPLPPLDMNRLTKLAAQRMDVVLTILSWSHADDGSDLVREGPSINSVDSKGRTALHYAAELGRTEVCMAILSSFGAILTIVDDSSRTPCELAGERSHHELAVHLEARALLYNDPYGVDDELMASILVNGRNDEDACTRLVPPFSWFETLNMEQVRQQRNEINAEALLKMRQVLTSRQQQKEANEVMYSYNVNDSLDSAPVSDMVEVAGRTATDEDQAVAGLMAAEETDVDGELRASLSGNVEETDFKNMRESLQESHVERFLAFHGWRMEDAISVFAKNPTKAFDDAGVQVVSREIPDKSEESSMPICLICFEQIDSESSKWTYLQSCRHGFCTECLREYVTDCARSRSGAMSVICPHHDCATPLAQSELQYLAPDVYSSLLEASDENFVASSKDLKFCPYPGCGGVVKRLVPSIIKEENFDRDLIDTTGAVCVACLNRETDEDTLITYEGVRDKRYYMSRGWSRPQPAHRFCFACGSDHGGIHWPVPCDRLEEWETRIRDEIKKVEDEDGGQNDENYKDLAQKLWIKANTRPCPQCKVPIEKNEGCNHMTCTNAHCRHEFCWICRKEWSLHNSKTGGFYRCNRWQDEDEGDNGHELYDAPPPRPPRPEGDGNEEEPQDGYGTALHASIVASKRSSEMNRFLHHYNRWSAHSESAELEQKMANSVYLRLASVVDAAIDYSGSSDFNFGGKGLSFVHAAFTELFECRSFLKHSYAFAFFRYPSLYYIRRNRFFKMRQKENAMFEQFQAELEMMTEQMSDIVARTHLRATQTQIMFLTSETAAKRCEFSNLIIRILDDERREQDDLSYERNVSSEQRPSIPRTIDLSEMIARLQSGERVRNMHDDTESDDGVRGFHYLGHMSRRDMDDDAALQQALEASLLAVRAEPQSPDAVRDDTEFEGPLTEWACEMCTYMNMPSTACAMCGSLRR